jgi:hypothetical protein
LLGLTVDAADPIIGGQGDFRYQYMPDLLKLPNGADIQDAHGLEVDQDHNIYVSYANWGDNTKQKNSTDTNCLIRWAQDGTKGVFMQKGGPALCSGKPHGLKFAEEDGKSYLYHTNVDPPHRLSKTTLEGEIIWQINGSFGTSQSTNYRPTWWAVPPGPFVYLADGYGSSNVYVFTKDGRWTNRTFGGKGKTHGKFQNCHGIDYDPRVKQLAVADRANHRIEFFTFDSNKGDKFEYQSTVSMANLTSAGPSKPCNFRPLQKANDPTLDGMVVVAALDGPVAVLDQTNKIVSVIDVNGLIGASTGSNHPHDAIFLPNGDIVVATWNPGFVSYWKLLPKSDGAH